MKPLRWDRLKSERLKKLRGLSFEEVLGGRYINLTDHPVRDGQRLMFFELKRYIWVIPFVENQSEVFLKTLYPSRYWTKKYKEGAL